MRRVLVLVLVLLVSLPVAADAAKKKKASPAKGPAGSTETSNEVKCGSGQATPAGKIYAGANGVEACSDENSRPDGRIIVSFSGRYASVDGDKSNGSPGDGFVRLDQSGPSCGNAKRTDSAAGPGGSCVPSALPVP